MRVFEVKAARFQRPEERFNSPTLPILLRRSLTKFWRNQDQIFAVLEAAPAQKQFHSPHPARFGNDQRAIDARPAKQPPGLHVLPAPVAHRSISVQSHLKIDPMTFEKAKPFAPDEFAENDADQCRGGARLHVERDAADAAQDPDADAD